MAHDVFICHASQDKLVANAACAKLEFAGIRCWIAPRDPLPGKPYGEQIVQAISHSRIVLLVFSEHANSSRAVLGELELASNREKIILPFRIEDVAPSDGLEFYIRSVHWLDAMTPPIEARLNDLVALVQRILDTLPGDPDAARAAASHPAAPLAFKVTCGPVGSRIVPGSAISYTYAKIPVQEDDEQVELVDAAGAATPVEVYERTSTSEIALGKIDLPGEARPGSKWRLRVTTWDGEGRPIVAQTAPFTVASAAHDAAPPPAATSSVPPPAQETVPPRAPEPPPKAAVVAPAQPPSKPPEPTPSRKTPIGAIVGAAAVLLALLGGYFAMTRGGGQHVAVASPAPHTAAPVLAAATHPPAHAAARKTTPAPHRSALPKATARPATPAPKATPQATPTPGSTPRTATPRPTPHRATPQPTRKPAAKTVVLAPARPRVPPRAFSVPGGGLLVMYDALPGVFWHAVECTQSGSDARVGFQLYNDYTQSLYYETGLSARAGAMPYDAWIPTRYVLDPRGTSVTFYRTLTGYTCGSGPVYAGLRRVRFGTDSGPYVSL